MTGLSAITLITAQESERSKNHLARMDEVIKVLIHIETCQGCQMVFTMLVKLVLSHKLQFQLFT